MKKKSILHKLTAALLTGTVLLSLLTGCGTPSVPSDTGNSPGNSRSARQHRLRSGTCNIEALVLL